MGLRRAWACSDVKNVVEDGCAIAAGEFVFADDVEVVIEHHEIEALRIGEGVVDAAFVVADVACVAWERDVFEDVAFPVEFEDSVNMGEVNGFGGATCALDMAFDGVQRAGLRDDGGNLVLCKADGGETNQ